MSSETDYALILFAYEWLDNKTALKIWLSCRTHAGSSQEREDEREQKNGASKHPMICRVDVDETSCLDQRGKIM